MKLKGKVDKIWGHEEIWATNDLYCGKFLNFNQGSKCSMHFHAKKDETWYVLKGKFLVKYIDTKVAITHEKQLSVGDVWHNPPSCPHQLICIEEGTIIEVSSPDSVEDNYRILPGDTENFT